MPITCYELLAQDINDYVYTCIYRENRIIKERVRVGRVTVMSKEKNNLLIIVVSFIFYEEQFNSVIYSATKLHSHHLFNREQDT